MLCSVLCKCGRAFQTQRRGIFHCKPCERSLHFGMTEWKERSICSALRHEPHTLSAKFHFYHSYNSSSWYIIIPKQSWSASQNICDIVLFFFLPHFSKNCEAISEPSSAPILHLFFFSPRFKGNISLNFSTERRGKCETLCVRYQLTCGASIKSSENRFSPILWK